MFKKQLLKSYIALILIYFASNITLDFYVNTNYYEEFYNFSPRDEITYKLMRCKELFQNNSGKFKILMVGDSRPESAFNPYLMDSYFNQSTISYNLGISGIGLQIEKVLFQIYRKEINPDLILWELNDGDFSYSSTENDAFFNSPSGRYYFNDFYTLTKDGVTDALYLKMSSFYRYRAIFKSDWNSQWETRKNLVAQHNTTFLQSRGQLIINNIDFSPIDNTIYNVTRDAPDYPNYPSSESAYRDIIDIFRQNSQKFYIVYGPFNNKTAYCNLHAPLVEQQFSRTLHSNELISFMGNRELANNSLYFNYNHLNYAGSLIYTRLIFEKIKQELSI